MLWHVSKISPVYQLFLLQFENRENINASKGVSEDGWMIKGLIALMFIQRWAQKICWKGYLCHKPWVWLSFAYFHHFTRMSKATIYITYFTTYYDKGQLRSANMMVWLHLILILVLQIIRNKVRIGNNSMNSRDMLAIYFMPRTDCKVL